MRHTKTPFLGIEAEGPERGLPTVFFPYDSTALIKSKTDFFALVTQQNISRFYFGAGDNLGLSLSDIEFIKVLRINNPVCRIVVEVSCKPGEPIDIQELNGILGISYVLVLEVPKVPNARIAHVKLVDEDRLHWYVLTGPFETSLSNRIYENDKYLDV